MEGKQTYEVGEFGPQVDEIAVRKNGIGLAELFVDEVHYEREMVLAAVAHVLNLRRRKLHWLQS